MCVCVCRSRRRHPLGPWWERARARAEGAVDRDKRGEGQRVFGGRLSGTMRDHLWRIWVWVCAHAAFVRNAVARAIPAKIRGGRPFRPDLQPGGGDSPRPTKNSDLSARADRVARDPRASRRYPAVCNAGALDRFRHSEDAGPTTARGGVCGGLGARSG